MKPLSWLRPLLLRLVLVLTPVGLVIWLAWPSLCVQWFMLLHDPAELRRHAISLEERHLVRQRPLRDRQNWPALSAISGVKELRPAPWGINIVLYETRGYTGGVYVSTQQTDDLEKYSGGSGLSYDRIADGVYAFEEKHRTPHPSMAAVTVEDAGFELSVNALHVPNRHRGQIFLNVTNITDQVFRFSEDPATKNVSFILQDAAGRQIAVFPRAPVPPLAGDAKQETLKPGDTHFISLSFERPPVNALLEEVEFWEATKLLVTWHPAPQAGEPPHVLEVKASLDLPRIPRRPPPPTAAPASAPPPGPGPAGTAP